MLTNLFVDIGYYITKPKTCLLIVLGICVVCFGFYSSRILFGVNKEIALVELENGYTIKIWQETEGFDDPNWNPEHTEPAIFYQVTKDGAIIIPKTFLGLDFGYSYDIEVVFAEGGKLVCVYDRNYWDKGIFVIFDVTYHQQWSFGMEGQQQRRDRYNRLKAEQPDLPDLYG